VEFDESSFGHALRHFFIFDESSFNRQTFFVIKVSSTDKPNPSSHGFVWYIALILQIANVHDSDVDAEQHFAGTYGVECRAQLDTRSEKYRSHFYRLSEEK